MRSIAIFILAAAFVVAWPGEARGITWSVVCLDPASSMAAEATGNTASRQVGSVDFGLGDRAAYWANTAASFVNLNPSGAISSKAYGLSATPPAGSADFGSGARAGIWSDTARSYVNLNPSGAKTSVAYATTGTKQAGFATFTYEVPNAALWSGTAGSFVNLNPSGAVDSTAYAISGTQQAGVARFNYSGTYKSHAAIWSGTAGSFVDLNPAAVNNSFAYATSGTQQAGVADGHAGIWTGTSGSFVDLNPTGAYNSAAFGTTGTHQVGYANFDEFGGVGEACIWQGTAGSYENLDVFLPPEYRGGGSWANAVYTSGGEVWVTGGTFGGNAILWHGVTYDLTIRKFFDTNEQDGVYNEADQDKYLSGWDFFVNNYAHGGSYGQAFTTDANGEANVSGLTAGQYDIYEIPKGTGWFLTAGANPRTVTVTADGTAVVTEFANQLPGDANQDETVNLADFTILKAHFGEDPAQWRDGNFNEDSTVNLSDFTILKAHFGEGSTGSSVPEPTSAALLLAAGLGILKRRRGN